MDKYLHCDDLIGDESQPKCLRRYLRWHRWPVKYQIKALGWGFKEPKLFADYKNNRVRVVMVSRFGDVGITNNLETVQGYDLRLAVQELSNFSDEN